MTGPLFRAATTGNDANITTLMRDLPLVAPPLVLQQCTAVMPANGSIDFSCNHARP